MVAALNAADRPDPYPIVITQADSFSIIFQLVDASGDAIALTGLSGLAQVRDEPGGTLIATLTVDVDQAIAGQATTGYVTVSASGTDMDQAIEGVWELELNDGTPTFEFRKTLLFGAFATTPQTTE